MTPDRKLKRLSSSSIAIGIATVFIALAAMVSFIDDPADRLAGWRLRGSISPGDAVRAPARLPAVAKRA